METLTETISRCKETLPLPELWKKLGLRGEPKRSCLSPFREERNESFSVFKNGRLWFFKDHATGASGDEIDLIVMDRGCEKKDAIRIYHELAGVDMPQKNTRPKNSLGRLIKIYDYCNAEGKLVHQTLRFEPKRFLQRRPAIKGMHAGGRTARCDKHTGEWWLWTLEGIEPVLYRLPELTNNSTSAVFVCEGEKDADTMASHGALATTAPMGAGKWRASYTETLTGRSVIICPDDDAVGALHAKFVAKSLYGKAKRIKIFRLAKSWPEQSRNGCSGRKVDMADLFQYRKSLVRLE